MALKSKAQEKNRFINNEKSIPFTYIKSFFLFPNNETNIVSSSIIFRSLARDKTFPSELVNSVSIYIKSFFTIPFLFEVVSLLPDSFFFKKMTMTLCSVPFIFDDDALFCPFHLQR